MIDLTFTLTLDEANTVLQGLLELPAKICNPLSNKIKQQAQEQIQVLEAIDNKTTNAE
jgi:hypothetical protein